MLVSKFFPCGLDWNRLSCVAGTGWILSKPVQLGSLHGGSGESEIWLAKVPSFFSVPTSLDLVGAWCTHAHRAPAHPTLFFFFHFFFCTATISPHPFLYLPSAGLGGVTWALWTMGVPPLVSIRRDGGSYTTTPTKRRTVDHRLMDRNFLVTQLTDLQTCLEKKI